MHEILFLTRPGCSQSPLLYGRLTTAMHMVGSDLEPTLVDIGDLSTLDPRTGYGTPTILIDGHDLFDVPLSGPASPT